MLRSFRPLVLATALAVVRGFAPRLPVPPLATTRRYCASSIKAQLPNIDGTGALRHCVTYPAIMVCHAVCTVSAGCA
jgi:hypothetical protein